MSVKILQTGMMSLLAELCTMYSFPVVERAILVCRLLLQAMGQPPKDD